MSFATWTRVTTRRAHQLRRRLLRLNFYRSHLAYFIITILIVSCVLYGSSGSSEDDFKLRYIDALFMAASAMTNTGLNTVNLNVLTGYQQSVLFVLMLLGDLSTVSISVVVVRRLMFRRQIKDWLAHHKAARQVLQDVDEELAKHDSGPLRHRDLGNGSVAGPSTSGTGEMHSIEHAVSKGSKQSLERTSFSRHTKYFGGVTAPWETNTFDWILTSPSRWWKTSHTTPDAHQYLSFKPSLDEKGRFRNLQNAEYEELGGVEYRALGMLCWILPTYTAFWVLLTLVILTAYSSTYQPIIETLRTSQPGSLNPSWWAVFISLSSYTNCGLSVLNASMMPFRDKWLILIVSGAAVAAGNTFYPIFLRFYVWTISKMLPKDSERHHALAFLLHHPRRCYLWLFDRKTTWALMAIQVSLILGEWFLFEVLNINTAVWAIPPGTRAMDGLYASFGTRSSGLYVVQISSIAPALHVIYLVVMYLSIFPLIISLRSTNIYEERSMGLEGDPYTSNKLGHEKSRTQVKNPSAGYHIRHQLAYDLWWIILSWVLVCIVEEPQLNTEAAGFNNFTILFEVVSAYGNCGLTLGVPYDSYALCGQFHTLSKLIMISVMLRGRHRILPMAIDRSILLPGQGLMEEMDKHYNPTLEKGWEGAESRIREQERGSQTE